MSRRQLELRLHADELVIDGFAGGGGASLGIEWALGRSPDIAINHDPEAIAMHQENHPSTRHYNADILAVDPIEATNGRPVGLAWFSPDCKHHSKAKGGKPRDQKIRDLAWVVVRWAKEVRPRVICVENVEEFADWGPLLKDGRPCPRRRGWTFRRWVRELELAGYKVETRELRACDYGTPTTRKRLFVIARCDGQPIVWPEQTHGEGRTPYRTAAECMEWDVTAPSIFERERPLADKTLRRIARGVQKFVIDAADPFVVPLTHAGDARVYSIREPFRTITGANRGELGLVSPTLVQTGWGERQGQAPRVPGLHQPLGTVVAGGVKHALVAAYLAKHYGGGVTKATGSALSGPMHTITAQDHHALVTAHLAGTHAGDVRAFLLKYYGTGGGAEFGDPMHTITSHDRFALVTVAGEQHVIADIGMRMLVPRELYRAQGFPDSYRIDFSIGAAPLSKTAQVRMVGNSVPPPVVAAIVRANAVGARQVQRARRVRRATKGAR